ncbi:MAG: 2-amino-4-hydroxy-6-hydroxymethyldihydropteridine diphosphokinase [Thermoleophilaceae bacterium]|nr:2-amino-4-hydroxy-6-hydroxymethyldihydropteridine diphosphokinase [Thermoleophilaceae bacterium]
MSGAARRGFLGLGSNEGERLDSLRAARELLHRSEAPGGLHVLASSSAYETEPQAGAVGQREFVNACLEIETALEPEPLLDLCKGVERTLGREAGAERHAPRPIDVDLLLLGELEHHSERLALPHADITRRRFVLVPLLELDPVLVLPDGTSLSAALAALEGQRVERIGAL